MTAWPSPPRWLSVPNKPGYPVAPGKGVHCKTDNGPVIAPSAGVRELPGRFELGGEAKPSPLPCWKTNWPVTVLNAELATVTGRLATISWRTTS